MKKIILTLLLAVCVLGFAACAKPAATEASSALDRIKSAGVLRVGVKEDVPGFSFLDTGTGTYSGMEIQLARLIAKELLGDESKVLFKSVNAKTRGSRLEQNDIDLVIATFTITDERRQLYNFSESYYKDSVRVMVKKDSGIDGLSDLHGKTVGVSQSATSKDSLKAAATKKHFNLKFSEFPSYPDIKAALDSRRIDAFCVDGAILRGYLDDSTVLLPETFSPQDYGIATSFKNADLSEYVDGLIKKWKSDGTLDRLIKEFNL